MQPFHVFAAVIASVCHGTLILQGSWSLSILFMWNELLASVSISVELQLVSALKVYHVCTSIVAFVDFTDLTLRCLVETLPPPSLPVSVGSLQSSEHDHTVGREPTAQSSICLHPSPLLQDQRNPQKKEGPEEGADMCAMKKDVELRVKPPPERQPCPKLAGIVIALCCHHRCNWPHLVGKEFFTSLGFSPADFHMISLMSSWAVCGVRPQKTAVCKSTTTEDDVSPPNARVEGCCCTPSSDCDRSVHSVGAVSTLAVKDTEEAEHTPYSGYVPHPREPIGLKCKRLIDFARAWYLRQHDFKARLVYFVEQTTSLENVLLIAVPP